MPRSKKKRNLQNENNSAVDRLLSVFAGKLEASVVAMVFEEAHRDEAVATEQLLMLADARDDVVHDNTVPEFNTLAIGGFDTSGIKGKSILSSVLESSTADIRMDNHKKTILLRGLPGSGKSYLAKQLKGDGLIISADHYFIDKHGRYQYKAAKLREAHSYAQMKARAAMKEGVSPVIIDNTNIEMWEMLPFVKFSIKYKYTVEVKEPKTWWKFVPQELAKRNKHNVGKEKIQKMLKRFVKNVTPNDLILSLETSDSMDHSRSKSVDRIQPQNEPTNLFFSNSVDYSHLRNGCGYEVDSTPVAGNITTNSEVAGNVPAYLEVVSKTPSHLEVAGNAPAHLKVIDDPGLDDRLDELFSQSLEEYKRASYYKASGEDDVPHLIEVDFNGTRSANEGFMEISQKTFDQQVHINNNNSQHSEMTISSAKSLTFDEPRYESPTDLDVKGNLETQFTSVESDLKVEATESSNNVEWFDSPSRRNRRHRPNRFPPKEINGELQWTGVDKDAWIMDEGEDSFVSRVNGHNTKFPEGPHAINEEHPKPRRDCQKVEVEHAEMFWETCESIVTEQCEKEPSSTDLKKAEGHLSLDDSSVIDQSKASICSPDNDTSASAPALKSCKKKAKRGSRLAAKFDNEWVLEVPSAKKPPIKEIKRMDPKSDATKVDSETMTYAQDFQMANAARSGRTLDNVTVLPAVGERFIPATLIEAIVSLNKSCSVHLDEEEPKIGECPMELLINLFPDCRRDLIADFIEQCQGDVSWAVNLLLDAGYNLRGEDVTFTLDETEACKVLEGTVLHPSDDPTLKKDAAQKMCEAASKEALPQIDVVQGNSEVTKEVVPQADLLQEEMEAIDSTLKEVSPEPDLLKEFEAIYSSVIETFPESDLAEEEIEPSHSSLKEILPEVDSCHKILAIESKLREVIPKLTDFLYGGGEQNPVITADKEDSSEADDCCSDQNSDSHESVTSGDVSFPTVIENPIKDWTISPENSSDELEENTLKEELLSKVVLDPKSMSDHRRRVAVRNEETHGEQPKDGGSDASSSGSEESSETAVLTMNTSFAQQLAQNFGSPLFGLDIGEFSTSDLQVNLPAELCEQIYNCWETTLYRKHNTQMKELERIIKEDEGKKSTPIAATDSLGAEAGSMTEIMELETALQKSLIDQDNSQTAMQNAKTYAAALATSKLQKRFPEIDPQTLQQVFSSNDDDYMRTVQMLLTGSQDEANAIDERNPSEVIMNPTPEDFRAEAAFYHRLKTETYQKAQEAHNKKMYEVATFYAKRGRSLDDKVREANRRASESILMHNNTNQPRNTLDLHHLFVDDALQVLSQWLDQKDRSNCSYVFIVTGWGKHSHPKREPTLRPAVMKYLSDHQYGFVENNKGKFRVNTKQLNGASR